MSNTTTVTVNTGITSAKWGVDGRGRRHMNDRVTVEQTSLYSREAVYEVNLWGEPSRPVIAPVTSPVAVTSYSCTTAHPGCRFRGGVRL